MLPVIPARHDAIPVFAREDCISQHAPHRVGVSRHGSGAKAVLAIGLPLAAARHRGRRTEEVERRPKPLPVTYHAPWLIELSTAWRQVAPLRTAPVSDCETSGDAEKTQDGALTPALAPLDSVAKRLKDMVFVKDMRAAMTSGEFALRLRGAERPGLVDYEGLYNILETFAGRLSELKASEVLREEDAWKAEEDLKVIQGKLQDRVVEMTQDTSEAHTHGEEGIKSGSTEQDAARPSLNAKAASQVGKKFMLYLRGDQMVDIDTALQESQAEQPFSRDLWERLEGKSKHSEGEWAPYENSQARPPGMQILAKP
ncbi:unnamed protein product [Symbiodinium pilosum]|uniref:Uncharacterized protein n=1 Tax=Symbiodinium pilosum TaxID=2952 RepID=A0A812XWY5_SYMPI|nr:unnamed protein product [Symbiodinium pilosum]